MNRLRYITAWIVVSIFTVLTAYAVVVPQDNKGRKQDDAQKSQNSGVQNNNRLNTEKKDSITTDLGELLEIEDETIPDSLLNPRWAVQRTIPVTFDDLKQGSADLQRPENLQQKVEYNDSL